MKKICLIIVICLALVGTQIPAFAGADDIKVKVNGELVKFDVKPFVENGRTLVPIRSIAEALKFKVDWDGDTSTATLSKGGSGVKIKLDSDTALVNGKEVKMDVTAGNKDGRTVVPLRFVSESLGCTVDWFPTNRIAAINEKTADGKEALFFTRLLQSEEYEAVDYDYAQKGYAYAPKDKKAKLRLISSSKSNICGKEIQTFDVGIELYGYDKYTRDKVKEILKWCLPNDYETIYMYLIVTLRKEVYEYMNELSEYPGMAGVYCGNRKADTFFDIKHFVAMVRIYADGYKPQPVWFRNKIDPEILKSLIFDESFRRQWDLNEYTIGDYKKVRGSAYKFFAYERDGFKLYTYGESAPPSVKKKYDPSTGESVDSEEYLEVKVENTYEREYDAKNAGYTRDDFYVLYEDLYEL